VGILQVFDSSGRISNWDALESIIEYLLYEQLGWPEGDEGYMLCTENVPCMPRSDRECLTQMLFETFNVRGCYLLDSSVASLYASGKTDGVVVDVGHTGTNVVQVRCPQLQSLPASECKLIYR
jgi:actin-related protein